MVANPVLCPGCYRSDYQPHDGETAHLVGGAGEDTELRKLRKFVIDMADELDAFGETSVSTAVMREVARG